MTDREILEATKAEIKRLAKVGRINGAVFDETRNEKGIWLQQADVCERILSFINSKQEEPVSEDLEEFALQYAGHHAPYDSCMQEVEDAVKAGAEWQKKHENPASEEFEKALAEEWKGYIDRGAATVDALEDNTQELAFAKGFYRGFKWQKNQGVTKEVVIGMATEEISINISQSTLDALDLCAGDKVIIQIRKKEDWL